MDDESPAASEPDGDLADDVLAIEIDESFDELAGLEGSVETADDEVVLQDPDFRARGR